MFKYEMHAHTSDCDVVAADSGGEIVKKYKEAGYSGVVITDHYFSTFFDWFKNELSGASHTKIIDRWLRGYYSALSGGEKLGFTVLCGAEVRFDGTVNDYLVYGLTPEFFYGAPLLNGLKNLEELKSVLPENALIVQAHPFRNGMKVVDPSPLFGIEVYNGKNEPFRNEMAELFADHYAKMKTSGSDYHGSVSLGKGGIYTKTQIKNSADLVFALKSGKYGLIEDGICV